MDFPTGGQFSERISAAVSPAMRARIDALVAEGASEDRTISIVVRRLLEAGYEVYLAEKEGE